MKNKKWATMLLKLGGMNDEVTKAERERKTYDMDDGQATPLQAGFTGDRQPTGGQSAKKELSAWHAQNTKFKNLKGKAEPEPKGTAKQKEFGSPLNNKGGGRAETLAKHDDAEGTGAEAEYKTGDWRALQRLSTAGEATKDVAKAITDGVSGARTSGRKSVYRAGSQFVSRVSGNPVVLTALGTYGALKSSGQYVVPAGSAAPKSDRVLAVRYTHGVDGKPYVTAFPAFATSFMHVSDLPRGTQVPTNTWALIQQYNQLAGADNLQAIPDEGVAYVTDQGQTYFLSASDVQTMITELEAYHADQKAARESLGSQQRVAVAPPGGEWTTKQMKKDPDVDNPWALAWWHRNKGHKLHAKEPAEHKSKTGSRTWLEVLRSAAGMPTYSVEPSRRPPMPIPSAPARPKSTSVPFIDVVNWYMKYENLHSIAPTTTVDDVVAMYLKSLSATGGYGPVVNKKQRPITPQETSWAAEEEAKRLEKNNLPDKVADAESNAEHNVFPDGGKGEADSWTQEMLDTAKNIDDSIDKLQAERQISTASLVRLSKSYGEYVREAKGKGETPQAFDAWVTGGSSTKEAGVDFTSKPDGSVRITVEPPLAPPMGTPPAAAVPPAGDAVEQQPADAAAAETETATTATASTEQLTLAVGGDIVDPVLGAGKVISMLANKVVASFNGVEYVADASAIMPRAKNGYDVKRT